MNLRSLFGFNKGPQKAEHTPARNKEVRQTAERALQQYEKTFKDLARYDRGELRPISR